VRRAFYSGLLAGICGSAKFGFPPSPPGFHQRIEGFDNLGDLFVAEVFDKAMGKGVRYAAGALDSGSSTIFQPDADPAAVCRRDLAPNEAAAFEPFQQSGNGGSGDVQEVSEFGI
jgi:hypothetical protein